jgi:membrane protease YdiL (CAAX protease family)
MISEKPWNREVLLLLVVGLMVCWCIGMLLAVLLEHFLPIEALARKNFYSFLVSILCGHGAGVFLIWQFLKLHGMTWAGFLGLDQPRVQRAILFAVLVAILVLPIVIMLNGWSADLIEKALGMKPEPQPTIKVLQTSITLGERICFGIAAILFAPVFEEGLFRGILYPFIKQRGYPRLALFLTSFVFGAIHLSLVNLLPLTLLAMVLVLVYEKTDKLIAPMVTHAFFNSVNFFTFIYQAEVERWLHHLGGWLRHFSGS